MANKRYKLLEIVTKLRQVDLPVEQKVSYIGEQVFNGYCKTHSYGGSYSEDYGG